MLELLSFSTNKLNIAAQIGTKYVQFGVFLLEDKTGAIIEALEKEHHWAAEQINMAILRKWLQGNGIKPVTWSSLVTVLREIEMNELADKVESNFATYSNIRSA